MPKKICQLKADLQQAGAYQASQKGSHTKWKHPSFPRITIILSGRDGDDAKPYQEKAVREFRLQIAKGKPGT